MASILVVEDNENVGQFLVFMFRKEGHQVTRFADGEAAFSYVQTNDAADLVLLDGMLPYRDGLEVLSEIRAQPLWARVPVIMLSARTLEREVVQALDAGANDYISKPFRPEELLVRVRRLLPKFEKITA